MPRYRVHCLSSIFSVDVEADDIDSARRAAFEDMDFAWKYDIQAEYPEGPWRIEVEELPEEE